MSEIKPTHALLIYNNEINSIYHDKEPQPTLVIIDIILIIGKQNAIGIRNQSFLGSRMIFVLGFGQFWEIE